MFTIYIANLFVHRFVNSKTFPSQLLVLILDAKVLIIRFSDNITLLCLSVA